MGIIARYMRLVYTAFMEGVATEQPPKDLRYTAQERVPLQCLPGVFRTTRVKTAIPIRVAPMTPRAVVWRKSVLIEMNQADEDFFQLHIMVVIGLFSVKNRRFQLKLSVSGRCKRLWGLKLYRIQTEYWLTSGL